MSYKCPKCGTILLYDYETPEAITFYCINCKKNVKLYKKPPAPEKLKGLNNWMDKTKAYYPDEALAVIDIMNNPQPEDEEFIKALRYVNKIIKERVNNGKHSKK